MGESVRDYWKRQLNSLKPGVTELYIHASAPGDEIKHITNSWEERATEYERSPKILRFAAYSIRKTLGESVIARCESCSGKVIPKS